MSIEQWVTIVVDLLKAYSWPITVVTGLLLFREEIKALLGSIRRVRGGPVEIDIAAVPEFPEPTVKEETQNPDSDMESH